MKSWIFILQTWTTFNIPITLSTPGVSVHRHRSWCEPLLRSFSIASALCLHSPTEGSKVRCRHSLSLHFFPKRLAYNMSIKLWRHNPENARIMRVHPKNKISKLLCLSVFLVCLAASPSPFCLWPRVCVRMRVRVCAGNYRTQLYDKQKEEYLPATQGLGMFVEVKDPDEKVLHHSPHTAEAVFIANRHQGHAENTMKCSRSQSP